MNSSVIYPKFSLVLTKVNRGGYLFVNKEINILFFKG